MMRTSSTTHTCGLAVIFILFAILASSLSSNVEAQSNRSVIWRAIDTEITIHEDGSFRVKETVIVSFTGAFRSGYREIPLDRLEGISNVQVAVANSQSEEPEALTLTKEDTEEVGTYSVHEFNDSIEITYYFKPTTGTEDRVIVTEYDVVGGLRVYPDETPSNQQLWWVAVSSDVTRTAETQTATVIVHLPKRVGINDTVWRPSGATTHGRTWVWQWSDLQPNITYDVRLQFPPITSAEVPEWQVREEEEPPPSGD